MKQLLQDQRTGEMLLADIPTPAIDENSVMIQNTVSLLMTEIQPQTINQSYLTFGGSCSGTVIASGKNVTNLQVGDRVACYNPKNGVHAELVHVPGSQVVIIPEKISYQEAAFLYPYMLCLSAHELSGAGLGSIVFIFGLDLIGQLLCQVLRACGCHVIVADAREEYIEKLKEQGFDVFLLDKHFPKTVFDAVKDLTLDAVFFAPSFNYIQRSLDKLPLVRHVILFNAVRDMVPRAGLSYHRVDIHNPFNQSRMASGENSRVFAPLEKAIDFNRWYTDCQADGGLKQASARTVRGRSSLTGFTKSLNMLFKLIETGRLEISDLVPQRYSIGDISSSSKIIAAHLQQPFHAVLLVYPQGAYEQSQRVELMPEENDKQTHSVLNMGLIVSAEESRYCIFNKLQDAVNIRFRIVSSPSGIRALELGKLFGFDYCTTNPGEIMNDREIGALVILNNYLDDSDLCLQAVSTQKKIFFECLVIPSKERLNQLIQVYQNAKAARNLFPQIMVGYYRRYMGVYNQLRDIFQECKSTLTLNARHIFKISDASEVFSIQWMSEFLHWIDLFQFLVASDPILIGAMRMSDPGLGVNVHVKFRDGSLANIQLLAGKHVSAPSERLEIFYDHKFAIVENSKSLVVMEGDKKLLHVRHKAQSGVLDQMNYFLKPWSRADRIAPDFGALMMNQLTGIALLDALQNAKLVDIKP